jgi:uncharacterized membrane protein (UPF0127 family)
MNVLFASACRAAAIALLQIAAAQAQDGRPQALPAIELVAGDAAITAEVARNERERETGLMYRTALAPDAGMLFVFGDPQRQCFWMRNTLVALAAAFIADDGRIVNIVEMAPRTQESHCSSRPVRFVLEMNGRWFARHGVEPGDYVTGEPFTR